MSGTRNMQACAVETPLRQPLRQRRRQAAQQCRAQAGDGSGGSPGQASRDAVLARINRAREYKKQQPAVQTQTLAAPAGNEAATPPAAPQAPAPAVQPSSSIGSNVEQAFDAAAQQLATKEEAQFLQAVADAGSSAQSAPELAPTSASPSSSGSGGQAASREAMLARINAARQYGKPGGSTASSSTNATSSSAPPAAPAPPAPAAAAQQQQQSEAEQQRSFRTGAGGADQAANWLVFAEGSSASAAQIDTNLSAEQFTLAKEELKKQQDVEIISVDAGYAAGVQREKRQQGQAAGGDAVEQQEASGGEGEEVDALHKPKVATWGIFPRPANISEAYGGGRNLRPGQALESEEAAAERQQRVSAALKEYRKTLGLDIDPEVEARAQALYNEGVRLFDQGLITAALPKFTEASSLMALRSRLGGEARLQQAICLDSLGQNQEAYGIYTQIENHSAPGVAKKAKRMLFGWKAAENLKTDRISYQPTTAQWKRYFDAINRGSMYNAYVASEAEESEEGGGGVAAAAVAVALLPLAFLAWRVWLQ